MRASRIASISALAPVTGAGRERVDGEDGLGGGLFRIPAGLPPRECLRRDPL